MTFKQHWFRGVRICLTVMVTMWPGAFYASMLAVVLGLIAKLVGIDLTDYGLLILGGSLSLPLIPYFVSDHADKIAEAANSN